MALLRREHPGRDGLLVARSIRHLLASRVRRRQVEDALQLEGRQPGVLREHERRQAGDVRCGEAVAGGSGACCRRTRRRRGRSPRAKNSTGGFGFAYHSQRVVALVAPDRDHRREAPRVALDRHVVRRGDEHRAAEVGAVGELVEQLRELALRRREAEVDDVEAAARSRTEDRRGSGRRCRCCPRRARGRCGSGMPARASGRSRRTPCRGRRRRRARRARSTASSPSSVTTTALSSPPTSGWSPSTPLSRMQTSTPSPVAPPIAQSRVTRSGHSAGIADRAGRLGGQAPGGDQPLAHRAPSARARAAAAAAASSAGPLGVPVARDGREVDLDEMGGRLRSAASASAAAAVASGRRCGEPSAAASAASSATSAAASAICSGTSAARRSASAEREVALLGRARCGRASSRAPRAKAVASSSPSVVRRDAQRARLGGDAGPSAQSAEPRATIVTSDAAIAAVTAAAVPPHGEGAGASSSSRNASSAPAAVAAPSRGRRVVTGRGVCAGARRRRDAARPRRRAARPRDRRRRACRNAASCSARSTSASSSARARGSSCAASTQPARSRWEEAEQLAEALFVVRRHSITMSTRRGRGSISSVIVRASAGGGRDSARSGSRSCRRGSSSSSPIVR